MKRKVAGIWLDGRTEESPQWLSLGENVSEALETTFFIPSFVQVLSPLQGAWDAEMNLMSLY